MPNTTDVERMRLCADPNMPMLSRLRQSEWSKGAVAKLSRSQVDQLPDSDLAEIAAEMSDYLPQRLGRTRLEFSDRATLLRLVHLVRRCCRHQGY